MILADPAGDEELHDRGFARIDLLSSGEVDGLGAAWREVGGGPQGPGPAFDAGLVGLAPVRKQRAHDLIVGALGSAVARAVPGHQPLIGSFAVKRAQPDSTMATHQDWTVVDERRWASVSIWTPLGDVNLDAGTLAFLPGSQRMTVLRGSGFPPSLLPGAEPPVEAFVEVPLRAGEALVYFHATIHRSAPNRSDRPRVAAMLGLVPDAAPTVHYHLRDDGIVEVRRAGTEFYVEHAFGGAPLPTSASVVSRFAWDGDRVGPQEVAALTR